MTYSLYWNCIQMTNKITLIHAHFLVCDTDWVFLLLFTLVLHRTFVGSCMCIAISQSCEPVNINKAGTWMIFTTLLGEWTHFISEQKHQHHQEEKVNRTLNVLHIILKKQVSFSTSLFFPTYYFFYSDCGWTFLPSCCQ